MAAAGGVWKGGAFYAGETPEAKAETRLRPHIERLDAQIVELNGQIEAASGRARAMNREFNPAMDTGGIRGRSTRQRAQQDDAFFAQNRRVMALIEQRKTLEGRRASLIRSTSNYYATEAMIARGSHRGEVFSRADLRELRSMLGGYERTMTNIEARG